MSPGKYPDSARLAAYTDAVVHRLERIRGVVAASSTTALPSQFPIDFPVAPVGGSDCVLLVPLSAWWGAFFLARFLRSLLFGISTSDGPTILVVIVTMTAVVVAATYLPAMRASRIDPMLALRQE